MKAAQDTGTTSGKKQWQSPQSPKEMGKDQPGEGWKNPPPKKTSSDIKHKNFHFEMKIWDAPLKINVRKDCWSDLDFLVNSIMNHAFWGML